MNSMNKQATTRQRSRVSSPAKNQEPVYQFKITLLGIRPLISRRIQVKDGTLEELHLHIQAAMGWTNSHLHHFKIGQHRYGEPRLMEELPEIDYQDTTTTRLSDILPRSGKRFRFVYEYDFGDGWEHEILFERCLPARSYQTYPVCPEGQRACPPENVGGKGGYHEFLEAIADPNHEQHDQMVRWVGGTFDAEEFDPIVASKAMRKRISRSSLAR
jgi:hypothetical protein